MRTRGSLRRVLTAVAITTVGLVPAVAFAPSASAAEGLTTTAANPTAFGNVLVGQIGIRIITIHNSGSSPNMIDQSKGGLSGGATQDFVLYADYNNPTTSCLNVTTFAPAPIAAGGDCTLVIVFFPTHFGNRATTLSIFDVGNPTATLPQFAIQLTGVGVGGYYIAGAAAEYRTLGFALHNLSSQGMPLNSPIKGISGRSNGDGFWLGAGDGGVFTAGFANFFGSMGGQHLNAPTVSISATPTDSGYVLAGSDGGVFTFGDAHFYGSMGGQHLNKPIVGMAVTPSGNGYWLVASDGGTFNFGDAHFFGSTGSMHLNKPIVGMAPTPSGNGYWLVASDGGIFTFGDAQFFGSMGGQHLNAPIVGMAASPTGRGYWLVAHDGGIFTFGDVPFQGSVATLAGANDVIGMAPTTSPLFGSYLTAPASVRAKAIAAAIKSGRLHVGTASAAAVSRW